MLSRHSSLWNRKRLATLLGVVSLALISLAVGGMVTLGDASPVAAQDLGGGEPAAQPAAQPAPQAGGEPSAGGEAPPAAPQENMLMFFFKALGIKYVVAFLLISFIFVALVVMNFLALRRDSIVPVALIEGFEAHLNEKRYQDAYELAKADESFLGHVLAAGLAKLSTGYPQAIEAMQEVGEDEHMKLEQRLSYVAMVGTIAPMVGLLGTVDGMVSSFMVIANSPTQPKPSELAQGISMALVTTLVGLWLAIPAIMFFGFFRNRLARLVFEVGVMSESLMSRFSSVGGKK